MSRGSAEPNSPASSAPLRDAWCLAFGALTTWRVPAPSGISQRVAAVAMTVAPLVMVPLVVLLGLGAAALLWLNAPGGVAAALAVTAHVLSTRGMHLDGLADTADGLSASYDRERSLAVMKTSDVGPSGVGGIVLVLMGQVVSLVALYDSGISGLAVAAVVLLASRGTLAWGCRRGWPTATPTGLGATVGDSVPTWAVALSALLLTVAGALAASLTGAAWWAGALPILAVLLANLALLLRTRTRLGGITGDVLGAGIEIGLTAGLLTAALLG